MSSNPAVSAIPWLERRMWALDAARGYLSTLFGVFVLSATRGAVLVAFFVALGVYLMADGVIDLLLSWRALHGRGQERTRWLTGLVSVVAGIGAIVAHESFLLFLIIAFGLRSIVQGGADIWRSVSSLWRRARQPLSAGEPFLWVGGLGRLALGIAIIAVSPLIFVALLLYLGIYLIVDGLVAINGAALKRGQRGAGYVSSASAAPASVVVPLADPERPEALRAVAFVRRSGANGLGHTGWAFEWPNGWFNAGSVENPSGAPFAPVEKMGMWTAHTLEPVATMIRQATPYDEFKLLFVDEPRCIEAWRAAVWVSRTPYSVQRRNCADATYDVLRTYGAEALPDTAQKSIPNEWYDAIPGPSYRIADHPALPIRPHRVAGSIERRARDLPLTISPRAPAKAPAWRALGGRAWYEIRMRLELINEEALQAARVALEWVKRLAQRPRRRAGREASARETGRRGAHRAWP
jgi:uncharacterized membrane protein HdeD (DUF308 family)